MDSENSLNEKTCVKNGRKKFEFKMGETIKAHVEVSAMFFTSNARKCFLMYGENSLNKKTCVSK